MSIPNYQIIMPALLKHIADGEEHSNREITEAMADHFGLSEITSINYDHCVEDMGTVEI